MAHGTDFKLIRSYDPEIRHRVSVKTAALYMLRREMEILDLPPEAKPIVFSCRALTRSQRSVVRRETNREERHILCFSYGVVGIADIPHGDSGRRSWSPSRAQKDGPLDDAALEALEEMGIGDVDWVEIGSAIEGLSFLAKGVQPVCPRPPSSLHAWDAQAVSRSPAERKRDDETQEGDS